MHAIMEAGGEASSSRSRSGEETSFLDLVRRSLSDDTYPSTAPRTMYVDSDDFWNPYKKSHQPCAVAIGPCYRGETLTINHRHKLACLHYLSLPEAKFELIMSCWVEKIRTDEELGRRCRPKDSNRYDHEFVGMLLLDACFILFILLIPFIAWKRNRKMQAERRKVLKQQMQVPKHKDDDDDDLGALLSHLELHFGQIKLDLLLLHNQIPFLVLQHLFDSIPPSQVKDISNFFELKHSSETRDVSRLCSLNMGSPEIKDVSLVDLALKFFDQIDPKRNLDYRPPPEAKYILHLLHLFHSALAPSAGYKMTKTDQFEHGPEASAAAEAGRTLRDMYIPSATELQETAVELRRNKEARSFLEVNFRDGVLQIPRLSISDYSGALFRNLIAFEQYSSCAVNPYIWAYAAFMGCIVRGKRDVRLLHQRGALAMSNLVGADDMDVVMLFRQFGQVERSYLWPVSKKLADRHGGQWPRWRAELKRRYFSDPWVALSVFAAAFLLCLAFLQTFYAIYAYHTSRPKMRQLINIYIYMILFSV